MLRAAGQADVPQLRQAVSRPDIHSAHLGQWSLQSLGTRRRHIVASRYARPARSVRIEAYPKWLRPNHHNWTFN